MSMCALKGREQNTAYTHSHLSNMVAREALKSPYNCLYNHIAYVERGS